MSPTYPLATWRLILAPHPHDGPSNMAIDEAILRVVAAGKAPPTLRLYAWHPPAITLGRGQSHRDVDKNAISMAGIRLLRRSSGGTAVLHTNELTYSIITHNNDPRLAGDIVNSYRGISAALKAALGKIDLEHVEAGAHQENRGSRSPVCFEIPSDYEIMVNGKKLIGSSQMRIRGGILQHGTLPIDGDIGRIADFLISRPSPERIRAHALTLYDALGAVLPWDILAKAFIEGFGTTLNLNLQPGGLTTDERMEVERLLIEKYTNEAWIMRL